jgi:hypothetical protein
VSARSVLRDARVTHFVSGSLMALVDIAAQDPLTCRARRLTRDDRTNSLVYTSSSLCSIFGGGGMSRVARPRPQAVIDDVWDEYVSIERTLRTNSPISRWWSDRLRRAHRRFGVCARSMNWSGNCGIRPVRARFRPTRGWASPRLTARLAPARRQSSRGSVCCSRYVTYVTVLGVLAGSHYHDSANLIANLTLEL